MLKEPHPQNIKSETHGSLLPGGRTGELTDESPPVDLKHLQNNITSDP